MLNSDVILGDCVLMDTDAFVDLDAEGINPELVIHYIGDPMCSWCWGVSPVIHSLFSFCRKEGIDFKLTLGGLRVGGGDPWNDQFKSFLRQEWNRIAVVSNQPFSYRLLNEEYFNYDTEPACRAVVVARELVQQQGMDEEVVLAFFSALQSKFFVQGRDPKFAAFYRDICQQTGLSFEAFSEKFESVQAKYQVKQEFQMRRQWGVRSYPTLLLENAGKITELAVGYTHFEEIIYTLRQRLAAAPAYR